MKALYIDHSDGTGIHKMPDVTVDDFKEAWIYNIKAKLLEIDQKSIRPTREGEQVYIDMYTNQALVLRDQITVVNKCTTIKEVEAIKIG